jgi:hypothetical protein
MLTAIDATRAALTDSGCWEAGRYKEESFGVIDGWQTWRNAATALMQAAGCTHESFRAMGDAYNFPADLRHLGVLLDYALSGGGLPEDIETDEDLPSYVDGWGFSDEWALCDECCVEVLRTSPDSYSWQPEWAYGADGERLCPACCKGAHEGILEAYKGSPDRSRLLPPFLSDETLGLVEVPGREYESGLHPGQNDSPEAVAELLATEDVPCWFRGSVGQFDVAWTVHVRAANEVLAARVLAQGNTKLPYDPAQALSEALKQVPPLPADTGGGIVVNHVGLNADGSPNVTTRTITPEEFVEGNWRDK